MPHPELNVEPKVEPPKPNWQSAQWWVKQLDEALAREKDFRHKGDKIAELFESGKKATHQFNILFSNTETLAPALYNSTPRPNVQRKFKDSDPLGQVAARATQRVLEHFVDPGEADPYYSVFDEQVQQAVLEALTPGRGLTRFKYEVEWEDSPGEGEPADRAEDGRAEDPEVQRRVKPGSERVYGEEVPWNRVLYGYAKRWSGLPWLAFEHLCELEEAEEMVGEVAKQIPRSPVNPKSDVENGVDSGKDEAGKVELIQIYEIWDKPRRKVHFVAKTYPDKILKTVDDPLELTGFYPCPKQLTLYPKINSIVPKSLYESYEEQAEELNTITFRINKLTAALKVRGAYDHNVEVAKNILEADDNEMIPIENAAQMYDKGGLDKAFWVMPVKELAAVLQQLYQQREQVKQTIYEISGIADIMRGASRASETLGAQEIKNQWGTLRLKKAQKQVMRYVKDSLRIVAEIAMTKFSEETLKAMTGLPFPTGSEKEQAAQLLEAAQAQGIPQEALQQDPQLAQAVQLVSGPSWSDILSLLRDDRMRSYRIDIETNSTIDAEATEDKKDIAEITQAISTFLQGVTPLVEKGILPFEAAKEMLLAVLRRFRFGPELEDALKMMKQPAPQPDPKVEIEKMKAENEREKHQMEMQAKQAELEQKKQLAQLDMRVKGMELQFKQMELQLKQQGMQLEMRNKAAQADLDARNAQTKANLDEQRMHREAQFGEHQLDLKRRTSEQMASAQVKRANQPQRPAGKTTAKA